MKIGGLVESLAQQELRPPKLPSNAIAMSFDIEDTIAAIASAPGEGVRGIVRISGPQALQCLEPIFSSSDAQSVSLSDCQRTNAFRGSLNIGSDLELPGELLVWPTRKSYTRQPTAEFHTLGSKPLLQQALSRICQSGARLANPGEFTLRAFLSGRIDMTQAEAVLAVIDANGTSQMNVALKQLAGGLAGPLGDIRDQLMSVLAELEAGLDFVEEDIEFISQQQLTDQLSAALTSLEKIKQQIDHRDSAVQAIKAVLFGMPNSGKSSLFNSLTKSDQAIVTDLAGTTTDFVSAKLSINVEPGTLNVELIYTAGFENAADEIKRDSQQHRIEQQEQALVRLFCIDGSRDLLQWELDQLKLINSDTIIVITKSDLGAAIPDCLPKEVPKEVPIVVTSTVSSEGLDRLSEQLYSTVMKSQMGQTSVVGSTVLRASESLAQATDSVELALRAAADELGEELVAAEIRQALTGLGQVVGTVYTDDILDLVFGRFCIGK